MPTIKQCPEKVSLKKRSSISFEQASELEKLFEVLANDTRLRLLHEIAKHDEVCTSDLAESLDMKPQAISNQLQRLQDKKIVSGRREGNNVYYSITDNCVIVLLERGLCLIEELPKRVS